MDAKCPECERVAVLDDDITIVKCPHCHFEADYDTYLEIMKDHAIKHKVTMRTFYNSNIII
jgi:ribosomal protein L37AE/L43A